MKLYLYDFDDTIYKGNTVYHFFIFSWKKGYVNIWFLFRLFIRFVQYKTKYISNQDVHSYMCSYFRNIDDMDKLVEEFWKEYRKNLKQFYLDKEDKSRDVIISASVYFLLKPICDELGVKDLIASDVCKKTGKFNGPACKRAHKVTHFKKKYPDAEILEMWSDSLVDKPLLDLAHKSFMVKGNEIYDYRTYKPSMSYRFWHWGWSEYERSPEVWNYLLVGFFTTLVSIGTYALFSRGLDIHYIPSNVLSWICAVTFAYFMNRWFVFYSKKKEIIKEAINFYYSRLLTLMLETALMIILVGMLFADDVIAKVLVQIIVLISNYILSKFFVFKKD